MTAKTKKPQENQWECPYCHSTNETRSREHAISDAVLDLYPNSRTTLDYTRTDKQPNTILTYSGDPTISIGRACNTASSYLDDYMKDMLARHIANPRANIPNGTRQCKDRTADTTTICHDYVLLQKTLTKYVWNALHLMSEGPQTQPFLDDEFPETGDGTINPRLDWIRHPDMDHPDERILILAGRYATPRFPMTRDRDIDILASITTAFGDETDGPLDIPCRHSAQFKFGDLSLVILFMPDGTGLPDKTRNMLKNQYGHTLVEPGQPIRTRTCYLPPTPDTFGAIPPIRKGKQLSQPANAKRATMLLNAMGADLTRTTPDATDKAINDLITREAERE
ncbi:hypothetical protein [Bifidobacterium callimiconis]|uniref:Uncharacterized protein n=1 Tax=Bifidobacterium callimiconis TaxID=2306973 RepID=A0A430FEE1_9BIFI|nr:hypothetical protein [Bifidobacterium callimiconis]RSX51264.1 hypothetical protein D2E23_1109 [Bifidobacterium callimiconis]